MYSNRDISWLSFNYRILCEAKDQSIPLMERFRFLSIFSSNLDEFFRVRFPILNLYSNLTDKLRNKIVPPPSKNLMKEVQYLLDSQLNEFGQLLTNELLPALENNNIILYYNKAIPPQFDLEIRDYFFSKLLSFIQPIFINATLSKDLLLGNNIQYLIVSLSQQNSDLLTHAFVNIPTEKAGRFHSIVTSDGTQHIFFIDDILRLFMDKIFARFTIHSIFSFKITRDSDLDINDETASKNILAEIEKKLLKRENGMPTRLLYEAGMPLALQKMLAFGFELSNKQLFEGRKYHNLSDFASLPISNSKLSFPAFVPAKHQLLNDHTDIFSIIETKDILLHIPYHSYNPILSFFNQAAIDPEVETIAVTLYRVADNFHIANALISAAKNGKKVTVFIELKARFDEANNIKWGKQMKKAGVKIVYSFPKIKVHSKVALVIKRNQNTKKGYGYIGTGNFNENTAKYYTDHCLLTTHSKIISDLELLFDGLSKEVIPEKNKGYVFNTLLISKNNLLDCLKAEINNQIEVHKKGLPASIKIKVNNLEDKEIIDHLYAASVAGVKIDLIVRSICCLVPGIANVSETITVKRIVDRFLEHSRLFIFGSNLEKQVYMGSADLMTRSLHKRIEVITPILDLSIANELENNFDMQWLEPLENQFTASQPSQDPKEGELQHRYSSQQSIYTFLNSITDE